MQVYIYVHFFCSESYMHLTSVVGTSAWVGVYIAQVCFYTNVHICNTLAAGMCICVYVCVYACICIWMRMCVYDIAWHVEALLLRFSMHAYVYVCACMRVCVHVHMYVYVCMRVCVYVCIYMYIHTRVGVHMCRRIFVYLYCPISPLHTCVSQMFV